MAEIDGLGARSAGAGEGASRANRVFLFSVTAALVMASLVGAVADPPRGGTPPYALHSPLVYRLEVGAAFFVTLYSVTVLVRLASHGLTPSRVGTAAVQIPQLVDTVDAVSDDLADNERDIDDMLLKLEKHARRIHAIEQTISTRGREAMR